MGKTTIHSLPPELLLSILSANLTFGEREADTHERNAELLRCSLVSKTWAYLSQSLLWRYLDFWEGSRPSPQEVLASEAVGRYVSREVWFVGYTKAAEVTEVEELVKSLKDVELLGFSGVEEIDTAVLNAPGLADLKTLSFNECILQPSSTPLAPHFHLASLRLSSLVTVPSDFLPSLFGCSPSLTKLHIYHPSSPAFTSQLLDILPLVGSSLTTFSISISEKSEYDISSLVALTPNATSLALHLLTASALHTILAKHPTPLIELELWSILRSGVLLEFWDRPVLGKLERFHLFTPTGDKILDACGGAAVVSIGHGQQRVLAGMKAQMDKEACESAIKLARQYHIERGHPERTNFISRYQSYHGNTLGALSLCRHKKRREPYLPLFSPTAFHAVSPCYAYRGKKEGESDVQYGERLANELEDKIVELGPETVAAFFAEPVVGATTGCVPSVPGYFAAIRRVCDKHGVLFVLDEIMSGIGRTGKMHAWEWEGLEGGPDIQYCGKGLSGGYAAVSAVLLSQKVVDGLNSGPSGGAINNGFTYQSSAIACRAAVETLKVMKEDNLVEQCHDRGVFLLDALQKRLGDNPYVGDIRGRGLFWGLELVRDRDTKATFDAALPLAELISQECVRNGLSIYPGKGTANGVNGDHVIIAPPYTISEAELTFAVDTLGKAVDVVMEKVA
ncbi:aminotransferase [Pseudohyphozyma bogoriensis]|nr:aminotransferase [Pseudohyphozyma bogoriensis]